MSEICTGAAVPELDGLASSGKDKEVKSEEGKEPEDRWSSFFFFKHVITDYIFREETVKEATHVTFFFWCKGSKTHFALRPTGQFVLSKATCFNSPLPQSSICA